MNLEPNRFFSQRNRLKGTKPPGGHTNDIFNTSSNESTPTNSPQKLNNYSKSKIFEVNGVDSTDSNGLQKRMRSPRHADNTQDRLFGTPDNSPRRTLMNDTFRSKVFIEGDNIEKQRSPRKKTVTIVSPITGEALIQENGIHPVNGGSNGYHHDNFDDERLKPEI